MFVSRQLSSSPQFCRKKTVQISYQEKNQKKNVWKTSHGCLLVTFKTFARRKSEKKLFDKLTSQFGLTQKHVFYSPGIFNKMWKIRYKWLKMKWKKYNSDKVIFSLIKSQSMFILRKLSYWNGWYLDLSRGSIQGSVLIVARAIRWAGSRTCRAVIGWGI